MADQNDKDSHDPSTEASMVLPLKKRSMAEESLALKSRIRKSDDKDVVNSLETLQYLQRKAYYSVLLTFIAETSTISNKRNYIIKRLMNQWKIPQETHNSFVIEIKKNLEILQQRDEMELKIEQVKTLTHSGSSWGWGHVDPKSLVGQYVKVKIPDETEFEEFIIQAYNEKLDMHLLVTPTCNEMEIDDDFSLFDLREIPPEDIMWEGGERPDFNVPMKSVPCRQRF